MPMLAETVDGVIGVDTHRDTHTAAACSPVGAVLATAALATTPDGAQALLAFGRAHVPGRRAFAVEGAGSYGAGLAAALLAAGEEVLEVERPGRPRRRGRDKDDAADAVRAARDALAAERLARPKQAPAAQLLRALLAVRASAIQAQTAAMNALHALVVTAPPAIRERLRGLTGRQLVDAAWTLPAPAPPADPGAAALIRLIAACAERVIFLAGERRDHDAALAAAVTATVPRLLTRVGVGPVSAAALAAAYGHHGRVRTEAAFARLAGAAPIQASSGQTTRHRLDRGGDRQLNRALHTIAVARARHDPRTHAYITRRRAQGKTDPEIRRCLKRYLARSLYRDLRHAGHALDPT